MPRHLNPALLLLATLAAACTTLTAEERSATLIKPMERDGADHLYRLVFSKRNFWRTVPVHSNRSPTGPLIERRPQWAWISVRQGTC